MQHLLYLTFVLTFNIREFLGQVWMKEDKKEKAQNICLITERFNDVSLIQGELKGGRNCFLNYLCTHRTRFFIAAHNAQSQIWLLTVTFFTCCRFLSLECPVFCSDQLKSATLFCTRGKFLPPSHSLSHLSLTS